MLLLLGEKTFVRIKKKSGLKDDDDDSVAGSELLLKIEIYCYKTALNKETFAQTRINNWSVQTLPFFQGFSTCLWYLRDFFGVTLWSLSY